MNDLIASMLSDLFKGSKSVNENGIEQWMEVGVGGVPTLPYTPT